MILCFVLHSVCIIPIKPPKQMARLGIVTQQQKDSETKTPAVHISLNCQDWQKYVFYWPSTEETQILYIISGLTINQTMNKLIIFKMKDNEEYTVKYSNRVM